MISYNLQINPFDDIAFNVEKVLRYLSTMSIFKCEKSKYSFDDDSGVLTWRVGIQNLETVYKEDPFSGNEFQFTSENDDFSFSVILFQKDLMVDSYNAFISKSFSNDEGSTDVTTFLFDYQDFKYLEGKKANKMFEKIKSVMTCAIENMKKENTENDAK